MGLSQVEVEVGTEVEAVVVVVRASFVLWRREGVHRNGVME